MDRTGRADHIEDYLCTINRGQWFGWSDSKNKIYSNLVIHDKSATVPTEQEVTNGLAKMQSDFDAQEYARNRQAEYPSVQELVVGLYDTDDKADIEAKRAAVKLKYPKPE